MKNLNIWNGIICLQCSVNKFNYRIIGVRFAKEEEIIKKPVLY